MCNYLNNYDNLNGWSLHSVYIFSECEIVKKFYRTFGLVNQDDSPDQINFYQTERKS